MDVVAMLLGDSVKEFENDGLEVELLLNVPFPDAVEEKVGLLD